MRVAPAHAMPGLTGLGRQLAAEYGDVRLRVDSVLPGPVLDAAWDDLGEDDRRGALPGRSLTVDGGWSTVEDSA